MSSASLTNPTYWWYRARSELLRTVFEPHLRDDDLLLDVGSADGPSVRWIDAAVRRVPVDLHPEGLASGGVCASVALLPFRDQAFDVVSAFDVVEHVEDETIALDELRRVVRPGGVVLLAVPAYRWAWTQFDDEAGHHRRYTRDRLVAAAQRSGFIVERATYAFAGTFPFFVVDRLTSRLGFRRTEDPAASTLPAWVTSSLMWLCSLDVRRLRHADLPFGSSVFVVAERPSDPERS